MNEYAIITLIVLVCVFIGTREFFCWYWKVNQRLLAQEKIVALLTKQNELLEGKTEKAIKLVEEVVPAKTEYSTKGLRV